MDALHPALDATTTPTCRSSSAARAPTSTTPRASATSTRWPACSSASSATAAPSSPRPPRSRPRSWRSCRCGPTRTRSAIELAERVADYAPGRPQPGLLHQRRRRGRRDRVEAGQELLQAHRQADEAQGDQPRDRLPRHHPGRAVDHRPAAAEAAVRAAGALDVPGAEHQLSTAPPSTAPEDEPRGVRPLGRRPDRGRDRERGPRHGRRRLPRAGAERRRLLPAAARLLPAGPRDLRRVRRAAGLRRGDLRVRPARPHVRRRALRLPARHDHLRQGHHLRLRPARRDDRHRPADGAVPARATSRSPTATPSAATRSRPRSAMATSTSSRTRASSSTSSTTRTPSAPRSSGSRTCRSSATSAATATSTASSWSRTRPPRRPSTTTSPRGCCAASCPRRSTTRASTAAPTTAATRSSSSPRR